MHEKSSASKTRDNILNHPRVKNMDAHERHALSQRIAKMSQAELSKELHKLYQ